MSRETLYTFPPPPSPEMEEWPGSPLGMTNIITRIKGRTKFHDKTIDKIPGRRDELVKAAQDHLKRSGEKSYEHDVVIHGIRVRAVTNREHLYDFWVDNWFSSEEWREITGREVMKEPKVHVYALGGVPNQQEAAYYSRQSNTIVFFNTSYYGQLKSWVLGAVGRVLAEEYGIHSTHNGCVEKDGKGILYIAPTGTGKSTSVYGMMDLPNSRFHSDDWVYTRYTFETRDGMRIFPIGITLKGEEVARGYRVYRWLEENPGEESAEIKAMTLDDRVLTLPMKEFDFSKPVEAYAYISEKIFYLRANLVENFPLSAMEMIKSKIENGPDVNPLFLQQNRETIGRIADDLLNSHHPGSSEYFQKMDRKGVEEWAARMFAFDNARAMLDISKVFGRDRVFTNPMEPVKVTHVMLLKRDFDDPVILESLSLEKFMTRLLIGLTPDKKREVAYNAYRAVDDGEEKECIEKLERELDERKGKGEEINFLYEVYREKKDIPESLYEEFELFRMLYASARCYDLNTILQSDPEVKAKREAVERTMKVIAKTIDGPPQVDQDIKLTIKDYGKYIS
ncbi:hypothetical protein IIA15_05630 [candidate division TA06 bacterium]|nr:hypothetical protein [candidate division TA06 bacterium]